FSDLASLAIDCVGGIICLNVVFTPNLAVRVWRRACAALTAGANVSARYSRKILNRRRHRSERNVRLFRCGLERFCQQILVADRFFQLRPRYFSLRDLRQIADIAAKHGWRYLWERDRARLDRNAGCGLVGAEIGRASCRERG